MTCNHEWGGVVIPGPVNRIVIDQCENCGELRLPDAPPAQAVDLGQFRDVVADWRDRCCRAADKDTILNMAKADRLLALIDSRDSRHG